MSTFTFTSDLTSDAIVAAYGDLDASAKGKARTAIADAIVAAVSVGDLDEAQRLVAAQTAIKSRVVASSGPDYVQAVRDLRADLIQALADLRQGKVTLPEGVTLDLDGVSLLGGTSDPKRVSRLATVSGRKAGRGSVANYVFEALSRLDGPATIADLRGAWVASEDYPKEAPTTGAIGACLKREDDERFVPATVRGVAGAELA